LPSDRSIHRSSKCSRKLSTTKNASILVRAAFCDWRWGYAAGNRGGSVPTITGSIRLDRRNNRNRRAPRSSPRTRHLRERHRANPKEVEAGAAIRKGVRPWGEIPGGVGSNSCDRQHPATARSRGYMAGVADNGNFESLRRALPGSQPEENDWRSFVQGNARSAWSDTRKREQYYTSALKIAPDERRCVHIASYVMSKDLPRAAETLRAATAGWFRIRATGPTGRGGWSAG